ncbi:MAG: hypothetical protein ACRDRA_05670 [Pseudonocardiaceae bacterium]
MHPNRRRTIRAALAELMAAVLNDLAECDGTPKIGPMPDYRRWWRQGQQSFVARRPNAWHLPDRVPMVGWLDTFPEMLSVRNVINADPIVSARVDTAVGTEFCLQDRRLDWLLVEHLLEPMVVTVHAYRFEEAVFDTLYGRLEAGLLADEVHLVEFLPLNGFISCIEEVELSDGLVLRRMTDRQMSAAIGVLAVPAGFGGGPNSVDVSWLNQWALMTERSYPVCSYKQGMPDHPIAPPFPSFEDAASRLVRALRIVCGGSAVTTRPIRAQHDDDFLPIIGDSAALPTIVTADLDRPTKLLISEEVDAVREIHRLLDIPAVHDDRALQTALRRLVFAGSRSHPSDRLIDLIICAEALFIKRAKVTGSKKTPIAEKAERLLADDPVLGVTLGAIKEFMTHAYKLRNAEVHGDDPTSETLTLLDGTATDKLDAVVDDLERVMRRAIYCQLQQLLRAAGPKAQRPPTSKRPTGQRPAR